jgi:4-aminobutyrate aminotransferase
MSVLTGTPLLPTYARFPVTFVDGDGSWLIADDGQRYLDLVAGIAVVGLGHRHPAPTAAAHAQLDRLWHVSNLYSTEPMEHLAERLSARFGGAHSFFCNSGTEAVEAAIKWARKATEKTELVALEGSFHGRTMGALSATSSRAIQRRGFGPMMPGMYHAPYANCYRCPVNLKPETCQAECLDFVEDQIMVHLVSPDEVAGILFEPIQGEGGYVVPARQFHQRLRELTTKHGILLIADEVQSGMGRTGRMFACEHFGTDVDIVAIAKGIASGLPLGVTCARADVMTWPPGAHASTFGGNPVSCAAALETIKVLRNGVVKNAETVGAHLQDRLRALMDKYPLIGDVRGRGLMIGVELVRDRQTKERATTERDRIVQGMFQKGVLLLGAGRNALRFAPPLILTKDQADTVVTIFEDVLKSLSH